MARTLLCSECKWQIVDFQGRFGGTCPMCGGNQLTIKGKPKGPVEEPSETPAEEPEEE